MPNLSNEVAVMLIRKHLGALRGYRVEAETQLARVLSDCVLGVSHAEETLRYFDHLCPTPKEISDQAANLRERFEPPAKSQKEIWKEQGYTYDPDFYKTVTDELAKQGRSNHDAELWSAIKAKFKPGDPSRISWGQMKSWKRQLGFPLNWDETKIADEWDKLHPIAQETV